MEDFRLKKAKLLNNLGMTIVFEQDAIKNKENHVIEKTINNPIPRHEDMDKAAEKFRIHFARIYKLMGLEIFKSEKDFKGEDKKKLQKVVDDIEIIGITLTGTEESDTSGVFMTAKMKVLNNKIVVLNTPNLMYNDDTTYGYIHDLEKDVKLFVREVEKYVIDKKYGTPSLFDQADPLSDGTSKGYGKLEKVG